MPLLSLQAMPPQAGAQHRDGVGPLMGSGLVLIVSVLAAHALCGPSRLAAQEGKLADSNAPRRRTYDESIELARRALDGQVRVTLEFVRRSCAPTPEQNAALERAGKELVAGRLDEARHGFTVTDLTLAP
ncbi:MAG TPA: hypothetical protein VGX78_07570, partial [Pirellulales bacterium]|nr:hypothetical protein [Pirellulales bacterium]